MVKSADSITMLNHSHPCVLCRFEPYTRYVTCETNQVLLVGVPGVFTTDWSISYGLKGM